MRGLIARLAPTEGYTLTALDGVRLLRMNRSLARMPVLYEPGICFICQGSKRGFLAGEVYRYDAHHYLVLSVPMPFASEADASPEAPLLGIALSIDPAQVAELALVLDEQAYVGDALPKPMLSTPLDERMGQTLLRLLEALASPLEAKILGPAILREIYFHVLTGQQGGVLRAALAQGGHFGRIAKALRRIHADYHGRLDVGSLARDAGMSVSAFHAHFRQVTSSTPIQYLKATRLHQARLLMIRSGMTAAAASAKVGYESTSQFSREFKRLFGRSPGAEAVQMKQALALSAAPRAV
ncbi:AraC family transcriptional regulator [Chitinimonas arctica]|uniref:AraC family transcriptional regulator n=2 Tax=Chitinimonas arctica TaxID=2594795 RepID=A0A516SMB4_9NEIS|nr:AraC family transcriptional regulator [Chitinimonas arctica]